MIRNDNPWNIAFDSFLSIIGGKDSFDQNRQLSVLSRPFKSSQLRSSFTPETRDCRFLVAAINLSEGTLAPLRSECKTNRFRRSRSRIPNTGKSTVITMAEYPAFSALRIRFPGLYCSTAETSVDSIPMLERSPRSSCSTRSQQQIGLPLSSRPLHCRPPPMGEQLHGWTWKSHRSASTICVRGALSRCSLA